MKELTIEEKAKAYDKAIEIAKSEYQTHKSFNGFREMLIRIFPELKENEDEKIRKALIKYFSEGREYLSLIPYNKEECVSWLEKQVTPQVRTGIEWVNTIDDACDKRYSEEYTHGEYCHEQSFKWGFQEGVAWLEKQGEQKSITIDIDKMVSKYSHTKDGDFGLPVNCQIRAYRQGINDALNLSLGIKKQGEQKPTWSEEDGCYMVQIPQR